MSRDAVVMWMQCAKRCRAAKSGCRLHHARYGAACAVDVLLLSVEGIEASKVLSLSISQ